MTQQILEGTWEEITTHAEELSGHRVRLTVFDQQQSPNIQNCIEQLSKVRGHSRNRKWNREDLYADEDIH